MKMRILNNEGLRTLKNEALKTPNIYDADNVAWIDSLLANRKFTFESKINKSDADLATPDDADEKKQDATNAMRLFEAYPGISPAQAADERLWATLCNGQYREYVLARWPARTKQEIQTEEGIIKSRYFFQRSTPRRSMERNGLARLWLGAFLTKDESRKNPYELTEMLFSNSNYVMYLLGHNFGSNKEIVKGTLSAMIKLEVDTGIRMTRTPLTEFTRHLNLLGGMSAIDYMGRDEIEEEAYNFMYPFLGGDSRRIV